MDGIGVVKQGELCFRASSYPMALHIRRVLSSFEMDTAMLLAGVKFDLIVANQQGILDIQTQSGGLKVVRENMLLPLIQTIWPGGILPVPTFDMECIEYQKGWLAGFTDCRGYVYTDKRHYWVGYSTSDLSILSYLSLCLSNLQIRSTTYKGGRTQRVRISRREEIIKLLELPIEFKRSSLYSIYERSYLTNSP